jgi:hypothetical protein
LHDRRHRKAERLGGLEIDHQLELDRLHHRQVWIEKNGNSFNTTLAQCCRISMYFGKKTTTWPSVNPPATTSR